MRIGILCTLAMLLAGCASLPPPVPSPSACAQSETSYQCQVERYNSTNM